jgi:hypothetical protein
MDTRYLPPEDAATLFNLAQGMTVLQLGVYTTLSTLHLAMPAQYVISVGFDGYETLPDEHDAFSCWRDLIGDSGCGKKVLGSRHAWNRVLALWPSQSFGLAVVNPHVIAVADHDLVMNHALDLASMVAIIDDNTADVERLAHDHGRRSSTLIHSGRLWIIQHAPNVAAFKFTGGE